MRKVPTDRFKISAIGGGHGLESIERALIHRTSNLRSIVGGQQDNTGHSGTLREELDIPGIGDLTRRISNHLVDNPVAQDMMGYRWEEPISVEGRRPATDMLAAVTLTEARILSRGVRKFETMWAGYVGVTIPITDAKIDLEITYADGTVKIGEGNVDNQKPDDPPIDNIEIVSKTPIVANPEAIEAIETADINVIGPGTFNGSIKPIFKIPGVVDAMNRGQFTMIFLNAFNHPETVGWAASKHLQQLHELGLRIDAAVINRIEHEVPEQYAHEGNEPVQADVEECQKYATQILHLPVTHLEPYRNRQVVKHNGQVCADLIYELLEQQPPVEEPINHIQQSAA